MLEALLNLKTLHKVPERTFSLSKVNNLKNYPKDPVILKILRSY